jgi:hypothetical protein
MYYILKKGLCEIKAFRSRKELSLKRVYFPDGNDRHRWYEYHHLASRVRLNPFGTHREIYKKIRDIIYDQQSLIFSGFLFDNTRKFE